MTKRAVYFINTNRDFGYVSFLVWDKLREMGVLNEETGIYCDNEQAMRHIDAAGNEYVFVPGQIAVCLDYPKYLPMMNEHFNSFDVAGMITWHEGASAPPKILTVHSLGDVNSGVYGKSHPQYMRNLLRAMESERVRLGMEDYFVVPEATHWSGVTETNSDASLLLEFPVPMMDIEIGSELESWNDPRAVEALANALLHVFDEEETVVQNLLCVGGVHFEPGFAEAVHAAWDGQAFGITHILANQWLVAGTYEDETGVERASNAVDAIAGGIQGIAFHDKMKGCYKDLVRALGEKYQVPIYKHQKLRKPEELEFGPKK